jgi:hypothetical protein
MVEYIFAGISCGAMLRAPAPFSVLQRSSKYAAVTDHRYNSKEFGMNGSLTEASQIPNIRQLNAMVEWE